MNVTHVELRLKLSKIISKIPLRVQRQQILLFQWFPHGSLGTASQYLRKKIGRHSVLKPSYVNSVMGPSSLQSQLNYSHRKSLLHLVSQPAALSFRVAVADIVQVPLRHVLSVLSLPLALKCHGRSFTAFAALVLVSVTASGYRRCWVRLLSLFLPLARTT